ncbi:Small nuclear ribonucleoprotein-associated protein B [Neolecta irregularis DAH-3]|uniref:Sm protein B n=1 Tax=Neolecta irregularis (strain DAH-3) TaxID=1198029 RepID=A0A1U7LW86_NEOID|nr:Small nuclear ribonucleoprotein-associated protein B [Neolecta irregularis DAH-3]|eukprot:OLL26833.1 Small nuclear ribonucleoprotein-associated protein B [Neolecta irregularis DAH-3]
MAGKPSRMQQLINHRLAITMVDGRQLTGQLLAFDKHMNVVIADTEEFRLVSRKKKTTTLPAQEEKRTLGLVILRGEHIVSLTTQGPPPTDPSSRLSMPLGQGIAKPAGRGMPVAPAGLSGPVTGIGGPALIGIPSEFGLPFRPGPPGGTGLSNAPPPGFMGQ